MAKQPLISKQVYFDVETERLHQALKEKSAEKGKIYNLSALTRKLVKEVAAKNGIN